MFELMQGQTILDVALIGFGNLESLVDIAALNNLSLTDEINAVSLPIQTLTTTQTKTVKFFSDRIILPPATNLGFTQPLNLSGLEVGNGFAQNVNTSGKLQQGQTILDIALMNFGNLESLVDIAALNNLSITDEINAVSLPAQALTTTQTKTVKFFSDRIILPPATNLGFTQPLNFSGVEIGNSFAQNVNASGQLQQGQTILDIALMNFGNLESLVDIAALNNLSITDEINAVSLPAQALTTTQTKTVKFFSDRIILPPATNLFLEIFEGIEFWGIEYDFKIS